MKNTQPVNYASNFCALHTVCCCLVLKTSFEDKFTRTWRESHDWPSSANVCSRPTYVIYTVLWTPCAWSTNETASYKLLSLWCITKHRHYSIFSRISLSPGQVANIRPQSIFVACYSSSSYIFFSFIPRSLCRQLWDLLLSCLLLLLLEDSCVYKEPIPWTTLESVPVFYIISLENVKKRWQT